MCVESGTGWVPVPLLSLLYRVMRFMRRIKQNFHKHVSEEGISLCTNFPFVDQKQLHTMEVARKVQLLQNKQGNNNNDEDNATSPSDAFPPGFSWVLDNTLAGMRYVRVGGRRALAGVVCMMCAMPVRARPCVPCGVNRLTVDHAELQLLLMLY